MSLGVFFLFNFWEEFETGWHSLFFVCLVAHWSWALCCLEIFDYCFSLLHDSWSTQIFYFFRPGLVGLMFLGICPFSLGCPICWCIIVHRSLFDLIGIWRAFHPTAPEYTFFSNIHGILSRINRMLGHIASLNKLKKIKILSSIFPITIVQN